MALDPVSGDLLVNDGACLRRVTATGTLAGVLAEGPGPPTHLAVHGRALVMVDGERGELRTLDLEHGRRTTLMGDTQRLAGPLAVSPQGCCLVALEDGLATWRLPQAPGPSPKHGTPSTPGSSTAKPPGRMDSSQSPRQAALAHFRTQQAEVEDGAFPAFAAGDFLDAGAEGLLLAGDAATQAGNATGAAVFHSGSNALFMASNWLFSSGYEFYWLAAVGRAWQTLLTLDSNAVDRARLDQAYARDQAAPGSSSGPGGAVPPEPEPRLEAEPDLFIGACLCATSIRVSAQVLREKGAARSAEGQVIVGAAVIDDVLGLLVLLAVSGVVAVSGTGAALPWASFGRTMLRRHRKRPGPGRPAVAQPPGPGGNHRRPAAHHDARSGGAGLGPEAKPGMNRRQAHAPAGRLIGAAGLRRAFRPPPGFPPSGRQPGTDPKMFALQSNIFKLFFPRTVRQARPELALVTRWLVIYPANKRD
jgi:hypothetical protein